MNTLNVSLKKIRVTVAKKSSTGSGVCLSDGRGHHLNHIKAPDEDKDIIRNHIKMFPVIIVTIQETILLENIF